MVTVVTMVAVDDCISPVDVVFKLLSSEDDREFFFYLRVSTFSIGQRAGNISNRLLLLQLILVTTQSS